MEETGQGKDGLRRTVSGLKRWTSTRSRRGTRDLMDLKVAWAAYTTMTMHSEIERVFVSALHVYGFVGFINAFTYVLR